MATSGSTGPFYAVERVLSARKNQGTQEYLIRWKGYDGSADSWEPEQHLLPYCQELVDEFFQSKAAGSEPPASGEETGVRSPPKSKPSTPKKRGTSPARQMAAASPARSPGRPPKTSTTPRRGRPPGSRKLSVSRSRSRSPARQQIPSRSPARRTRSQSPARKPKVPVTSSPDDSGALTRQTLVGRRPRGRSQSPARKHQQTGDSSLGRGKPQGRTDFSGDETDGIDVLSSVFHQARLRRRHASPTETGTSTSPPPPANDDTKQVQRELIRDGQSSNSVVAVSPDPPRQEFMRMPDPTLRFAEVLGDQNFTDSGPDNQNAGAASSPALERTGHESTPRTGRYRWDTDVYIPLVTIFVFFVGVLLYAVVFRMGESGER